jgi:hypothetical protein
MSFSRLTPETTKYVTNYMFGPTRNILLGMSLAYSTQKEKYIHYPIILFFPSIYAGYHIYKNKEDIRNWIFE